MFLLYFSLGAIISFFVTGILSDIADNALSQYSMLMKELKQTKLFRYGNMIVTPNMQFKWYIVDKGISWRGIEIFPYINRPLYSIIYCLIVKWIKRHYNIKEIEDFNNTL